MKFSICQSVRTCGRGTGDVLQGQVLHSRSTEWKTRTPKLQLVNCFKEFITSSRTSLMTLQITVRCFHTLQQGVRIWPSIQSDSDQGWCRGRPGPESEIQQVCQEVSHDQVGCCCSRIHLGGKMVTTFWRIKGKKPSSFPP